MSDSKRNLILTFAHGYTWPSLEIFFNSLRASGFDGDIAVFSSRLDSNTIKILEERGITVCNAWLPLFRLRNILLLGGWKPWKLLLRLLPSLPLKRAIGKRAFNIMCARFAHFHEFLEQNADRYAKVLITDIRDVCFQADPFAAIEGDGIVSFLEPIKIEGGANGQWMQEAYGAKLDPTILNESVCCAGVTIGATPAVMDYLTQMLRHLCEVDLMTPVAGVDQAIHNFLFHRDRLAGSQVMKNGNPLCLTMGSGEPFTLDEEERLVADGKVVAILHQYDRHPELKGIMAARFGQP